MASSATLPSPPPLSSVLVVGGCGFLGHHIVSQLLALSPPPSVSVLDLDTAHNRLPDVAYHSGDITSAATVEAVLASARPAVVIHTASPVAHTGGAGGRAALERLYAHVNVTGTRTLLEGAARAGTVVAFVYTSSASVVHDGHSDLHFATEATHPPLTRPRQTAFYAHTKALAEAAVLAHNAHPSAPRMLTCAIRPAGIFGEGDRQMVPAMLDVYRRGQHRVQVGDNANHFDFTYVGNVAHAHVLAAQALLRAGGSGGGGDEEHRVDGEAFLVTNDSPVPFWDFPRAIWAAAGSELAPDRVWTLPEPVGMALAIAAEWIFWAVFLGTRVPRLQRLAIEMSCRNRTFTCDKAKRRLGYRVRWGLEEGIERTVRWAEEDEERRRRGEAGTGGREEKERK